MRPQDLYADMPELIRRVEKLRDELSLLPEQLAIWDERKLRVDGENWTVAETVQSVAASFAGALHSMDAAHAHLEGAWAGLGRLAAD